MTRFLDLSYRLDETTPGLSERRPDGSTHQAGVTLGVWRDRETSGQMLQGQASFEVSTLAIPGPVGTYMDSPYCRWPERRDIGALELEDLILPGVALDLRGRAEREAIGPEALPPGLPLAGAAVLLNFGWDRHWGTPAYRRHPYIVPELAARLQSEGAKLVGLDTPNADGPGRLDMPIHSHLLGHDILIVENLRGLEALHGRAFRFFAVPVKVRGATSMPLRAFAELL